MSDDWSQDFYVDNVLFRQIAPFARLLSYNNDWPDMSDFNQMLSDVHGQVRSSNGALLRFVEQGDKTSDPEKSYEARICLKGEIQTRSNNWHDYFQVLIWCTFSKTKQLINLLHYEAFTERVNKQLKNRSSIENTLTLFDECGVVIVSSKPELLQLINDYDWTALFISHREAFNRDIKCFTFGHALYEKYLSPYIGMTAHSICLTVDPEFFKLDDEQQLNKIDELAYDFFTKTKTLTPAATLTPFPVLGIPGWDSRNNDPEFYQNKNYFREKRFKT